MTWTWTDLGFVETWAVIIGVLATYVVVKALIIGWLEGGDE